MATGRPNRHKKYGKHWTSSSRDMLADRYTDTWMERNTHRNINTYHNTSLPYQGWKKYKIKEVENRQHERSHFHILDVVVIQLLKGLVDISSEHRSIQQQAKCAVKQRHKTLPDHARCWVGLLRLINHEGQLSVQPVGIQTTTVTCV